MEQALNIASFIAGHPNLPEDKIPYWDFNSPEIHNAHRDASAAAIMASAFIELSSLDKSRNASKWLEIAKKQIRSLSSPEYLAEVGSNGYFILKHSIGNHNINSEVDVPLSYADYYYVEALLRMKKLQNRNRGGKKAGSIKNVYVHDMKVQVAFGRPDINYDMRGPAVNFFHNPFPSSITGIPGHDIENVRIEDVEITYPGRASKGIAYVPLRRLSQVPEQIKDYPEFNMFRELPSWGFYVRHVYGISFKNVAITVKKTDFRPAYVFDDVSGVHFDNVNINENNKRPQIILKKVTDPNLKVRSALVKTVK